MDPLLGTVLGILFFESLLVMYLLHSLNRSHSQSSSRESESEKRFVDLAALLKARDLGDFARHESAENEPVFDPGIPVDDEYEAELERLVVERREIKPHEVPGPRLRGED